jgi:hypothetical protein
MSPAVVAALLVLGAASGAAAADVPGATIVLEVAPGTPGSDPSAAPPRFVLLEDGQVFVGGTARLESGRLEKREASVLLKRAEAVRKLRGLSSPVAFGGDPSRTLRLRILDGKPFEAVATGDPQESPPTLAPLASLLVDLLGYHHPSLRPYAPAFYAMAAREARLPGGCRAWRFAFPVAEVLASPRTVSAEEVAGWPTGARPASVCVDDRRYVVTLRPLLPGERP